MSIATLRYAPWQDKSHLSQSQYDSLTAAVTKVLCHTVSLPDSRLDIGWARTFVRTYAQDDAHHALQVLDNGVEETKLTPHELSVRRLTLHLAKRLAQIRDGLDVSVLVDLAVSYGARNASSMKFIFQESCITTPSLRDSFMIDVVPAFGTSLQEVQNRSAASTRRVAYVLSQLLRCGPTIVTSFVQTKDFILKLARCYHTGLDTFANYHGGVTLQDRDPKASAGWQRDWLYTKTSLVDSFHVIVQTLLEGGHNEQLFDLLFSILDLPSSSISKHTAPTPFISQPLLSDYQYAFDLSGVLSAKLQGADDARVDLLASTLTELSPSPHGTKPAGGLSLVIKENPLVQKVEPPTGSDGKGKGKARIQDPARDIHMDRAIAQVMDIFPSHSLEHVRRCLEHPSLDGDPVKLISSLLEGTLPAELVDKEETPPGAVPPAEDLTYVKDRRNAWDGDIMDFSRLRIGKTNNDADALLHDRSFIEQMKADIIRRAEELSGDEEDTMSNPPLAGRGRTVPFFEEELDDDSLADKGVKVAGDGEASDGADGDDETENETPSTETILELAYLDNPKVFDRDSSTRRSKARAELKLKTGWVDEQIEGWRIMLERNPRKHKILQKHEFSGNAALMTNTNAMEPGPSGTASPQHGGKAKGRGGNGGANNNAAQGRTTKEKNKSGRANHNRKRGHDKKMTRGGVPIA